MTLAVSELATRLAEVRERIARAAERSRRAPESVTLIAVTKTHPASTVVEALRSGLVDFGENRVQEGVAKAAEVSSLAGTHPTPPTWHLIGHLQTNKVRAALGTFAILHSVDSERLMRAVSAAATSPVRIFIEVNVAAEPQKYGIAVGELPSLVELARSLPNIDLTGLMTVAPHEDNSEATRLVFRALRNLAEANRLESLSMGMTNDYEVAIEEGATHVRIGRALFGDRA
ncbi:MAG: YggS family pyridoxal phosphate-dependent enzyme [Dehalococcoidia bacterium]